MPLVPSLALIVEDDPLQREVLAEMMGSANLDVISCASAAAAELIISKIAPELRLVVIDLWLGGECIGSELAWFARQRAPGACLLIISGDEEARIPPGSRRLRKPYRPADVLQAVAA